MLRGITNPTLIKLFSFSTNSMTCFVKQKARLTLGLKRRLIEREYLIIYSNSKLCVLEIIKLPERTIYNNNILTNM